MDSESDRLALVKALGGQLLHVDAGDFWAIFDPEYLGHLETETRVPVLTYRTSDAERYIKPKGTAVPICNETYRVRRHEPDGTGMSIVYLES